MKKNLLQILIIFSLVIFNLISLSFACTGIQLKAKDGSAVNGRTVEFGLNLELSGLMIPRNYPFKGTLPDGSTGMVYQSKYAAIGGVMFGENAIADGLNEKGLAIGDFYFPGYAGYAAVTPQNKNNALSPTEFSNWVLTQFATVDEVKEGIKSVVIAGTTPQGWPTLPPFHYVVYDKTGKSIVIEPVNGKLNVYDNPLGVLTNSPSFDWHMTNLASYINLSPLNAPAIKVDGVHLQEFGAGSGMHGLPGDFTPPSRFVRAAIFSTAAIPSNNAQQAIFQIFHILNQFDIPMGSVRATEGKETISEYTLATIARDLQSLKFYFKTFDNQTIKMANLNAFDLNAKELKKFDIKGGQQIIDISPKKTP
jgi:choloylglycine hydrolase